MVTPANHLMELGITLIHWLGVLSLMIVNLQHAPVIHHLLFVVTVLGHVYLPACGQDQYQSVLVSALFSNLLLYKFILFYRKSCYNKEN